jgi:hypothetical protein
VGRPRPRGSRAGRVLTTAFSFLAGCYAFSFLIYPPTGAQRPARPGGLLGGFPDPAKLICIGFAKNGLASPKPRRWAGRAPGAAAYVSRGAPSDLPCTSQATYPMPSRTACTTPAAFLAPALPAGLPYTSQVAYPIPPAFLAPALPDHLPNTPRSPTLCLPDHLPYTALVPLLPAPPSYVPHSPTFAKLNSIEIFYPLKSILPLHSNSSFYSSIDLLPRPNLGSLAIQLSLY